jgi:hypothetical protein
MKRWILAALTIVTVASTMALSQEAEEELEAQAVQMELAERATEFAFQQEMRELELEKLRIEIDRERAEIDRVAPGRHHKNCGPFLLLCLLVHVLLTVWVYLDIRKRNTGSAIWIVLALLSGFFGALLYVLVRLGDGPPPAE